MKVIEQQPPAPNAGKRPLLTAHPSVPGDFELSFDNTTLQAWQQCPRRGHFYTVERRERPSTSAMSFGSAIHAALEQHMRDRPWEDVLHQYFVDNPTPDGEYRNHDYAVSVMEKYLLTYPEPIPLYQEDSVEVAFKLPLTQLTLNRDFLGQPVKTLHIYWTGRVDALVITQNQVWVMDHKTTSRGGQTFFDDFYLNQAQIGYVFAARQIWGRSIRGSILNALIVRKQTRTGKGIECTHQFFPYEDWQLNEWQREVIQWISTVVGYMLTGTAPKAPFACIGKYGKCPYHDVCSMPPTSRPIILHSDQYTDVSWTPLH